MNIPQILGILNTTPDSFYDGGTHTTPETIDAHARQLVAEGADIIDIGGQSTRPGHTPVSIEEETARTIPHIRRLAKLLPQTPVSIDTYHPEIARQAADAGATIINDIHGLQVDPGMPRVIAGTNCRCILMHNDPDYPRQAAAADPIQTMRDWLRRSLDIAARHNIPQTRIILDPGIGFHKTHDQNLAILARLDELRDLGCPLLLAHSRKSIIGHLLNLPNPADRLEGTLALTVNAVFQNIDYIRVHDVAANKRAAQVAAALRNSRQSKTRNSP